MITCPAGCYVSEMGVSKNADGNYEVIVKAGDVISMNPWGNATATYTITATPVEPEAPEQGGEELGNVLVYLGSDTSGRATKVIVYTEEDKMEFYRSNSSGSFDNVVPSTFTWSADMTSATSTSGNYTSMVLENGVPVSATCMGQVTSNFVLQA